MSDLQKAIEQNVRIIFNMGKLYERGEIEYDLSKGCNRIKSLLEQVAKEQRELCYKNHWDESCRLNDEYFEDEIRDAITEAPLVTDNLTFNED